MRAENTASSLMRSGHERRSRDERSVSRGVIPASVSPDGVDGMGVGMVSALLPAR